MKRAVLFILVLFFYRCGNNVEKKDEPQKAIEVGNKLQDSLQKSDSVQTDTLLNSLCKNDTTTLMVKNEHLTYEQAYDRALTLWQIPLKEIYVETSFGKAHVITCGPADGEPLILLHGMDASSTMWYPNIKTLAKQFRIYAIDFLLEPGKSVCSAEIKHTDQIVEWYYEIFDKLKLKKVSIVGASRGGWLAINIALRNKARINKMALLSPAQTFTWIKLGPKTLFNIAYSVFPKRKKFRNVMETVTVDVDKINQLYLNQYYLATKKGIFHKCFLQMTPFPEKELKSLKMPILVLIGDHDIINNDKSLKRAKKDFLNIKTKEIKNSGHFLSIDQPEIVDKLLIDFLK